ncbi:hypothetical protein P7C73_g18, partial [Tremellales sp. Uapishka_1]
METYHLPHFPPAHNTIHIASFSSVTNSPQIRRRLITASTLSGPEGDLERAKVDFGFLEGKLLVSKIHLLTAIQTTLLYSATSTRTHNLHSEILLYLSPNNNISDAIRKFGLSDQTTHLVLVKITDREKSVEEVWKEMEAVVEGELESLDVLDEHEGGRTDWKAVDKLYKLGEMNQLKLGPSDLRQKKRDVVVNTVAIQTVAS